MLYLWEWYIFREYWIMVSWSNRPSKSQIVQYWLLVFRIFKQYFFSEYSLWYDYYYDLPSLTDIITDEHSFYPTQDLFIISLSLLLIHYFDIPQLTRITTGEWSFYGVQNFTLESKELCWLIDWIFHNFLK